MAEEQMTTSYGTIDLHGGPVWVRVGGALIDASAVTAVTPAGWHGAIMTDAGSSRRATDVHLTGTVLRVLADHKLVEAVVRRALEPLASIDGFDEEATADDVEHNEN